MVIVQYNVLSLWPPKTWKKKQNTDVRAEQNRPAYAGRIANAHANVARAENAHAKKNAPVVANADKNR